MSKKEIFSDRYDIEGSSVFRLCQFAVLAKFFPVGNLRGGPGIRCLVVLAVLHSFGARIFTLAIRQEARLHRLYQAINRFRRR